MSYDMLRKFHELQERVIALELRAQSTEQSLSLLHQIPKIPQPDGGTAVVGRTKLTLPGKV